MEKNSSSTASGTGPHLGNSGKNSISLASGPGPHLDMEHLLDMELSMALGPGPHLDMELMMALGPGPHLDMDLMTPCKWIPKGVHCCAPSPSPCD